jgi:acetyl esterase/lipase
MDIVKTITSKLPEGIAPTYKALLPHLIANQEAIKGQYARRETHSYSSDPRQDLDVYYPDHYDDSTPVLVFLFGGGFFSGNKQSPPNPDLIYANLGGFFCEKGFITIVANYRLAKGPGNPEGNAKYPDGGEDTALAVKWVTKTLGNRSIFLMGHSAGAVHVMTLLFEPSLLKSIQPANIAGAILVSPLCHPKVADPSRTEIILNYYGDAASNGAHFPLGLLLKNGPVNIPILSLVASLDEPGIIQSLADFKAEYAKLGGKYDEIIMQDHNHISPLLALNSTEVEGSKWGDDVADWMLKRGGEAK